MIKLFTYNYVVNSLIKRNLFACALVWEGCHYKVPQTAWLKQYKFLISQFWRLEVQYQGIGRVGSF